MFNIGDKLTKENYTQGAIWCNENGFVINSDTWVIEEAPQAPEPTYAEKRAMEYPSIQDQLDMLYWDKVNGTNTWQEKIAEIKAKYPKEEPIEEIEELEE